jgi:uncharacterized protein (TIGR02147 family)
LAGTAHLTNEQAFAMGKSWGLDDEAIEYLGGLVQMGRSATKEYRLYWEQKLRALSKRKEQLSERITTSRTLTGEEQARYYSTWFYPAIHTLASIKSLQNVNALTARLNLPRETVARAIAELAKMGLISVDGDKVATCEHDVHTKSSGLMVSHHAIWRNIANQRLQDQEPGSNYHYTALYGLSEKDVLKLKDLIAQFIRDTRAIVAPSKEETAVCLAVDMFQL